MELALAHDYREGLRRIAMTACRGLLAVRQSFRRETAFVEQSLQFIVEGCLHRELLKAEFPIEPGFIDMRLGQTQELVALAPDSRPSACQGT